MSRAAVREPMNGAQRQVLRATCASHALIHVYELCVPPLLLLVQAEFGAGDFAMGRVVTLLGLFFGLGALPAGYLVDRIGSRSLLVACLWGGSLSLLGMAASPSLPWFAVACAAAGLSLSIYHPAGTALITHSIPVSGRVFALHGMAGNLGVAGAAVLAGSLGALAGWRTALAILAVAGLLLGARVLALPEVEVEFREGRRAAGTWTSFGLLLVAITFMGMVYRGMTTFLPKLFATQYTADAATGTAVGGSLTTAALLVGLAGMWAAGKLVDRGVRPAAVFVAAGVLQLPFLLAIGSLGGGTLLPLVMGVAFFHFFTQPAGNHLVADLTPPHLRGLGYGVYFFLSFGVGAVGAAFGGWVSERHGLTVAFPALAVLLVPSIVAAVFLAVRTRGVRASAVTAAPQG